MVLSMETEVNMYEVAARHKKAARLAILLCREFSDVLYGGLTDDPQTNANVRSVAAAYGINRPSDETLAEVRALLNESY